MLQQAAPQETHHCTGTGTATALTPAALMVKLHPHPPALNSSHSLERARGGGGESCDNSQSPPPPFSELSAGPGLTPVCLLHKQRPLTDTVSVSCHCFPTTTWRRGKPGVKTCQIPKCALKIITAAPGDQKETEIHAAVTRSPDPRRPPLPH